MPLQETSGAASYDAYGGGVAGAPTYIEDVFSTWLYTGNGSTQTITNGIDLAGMGGLLWIKNRNEAYEHSLFDTARGINNILVSNTAGAQSNLGSPLTALSSGFSLNSSSSGYPNLNDPSYTYASWTFRKQPKFFDVVTYTGDGTSGLRYINQSLGSAPGFIIVKKTSSTGNWFCYSRGLPSTNYSISLNLTDAATDNGLQVWDATATQFAVHSGLGLNTSGATYVAYLFAHNAGGFGLTGTDNVISCGSFTNNASVINVNLGYEPQWVLYKNASQSTGWNWAILDNMRGWVDGGPAASDDAFLFPNLSNAEVKSISGAPTATGFRFDFSTTGTDTFIYIAIRRGPMKVPTDATKVFSPNYFNNTAGTNITTGFPVDLCIQTGKDYSTNRSSVDRLRGTSTVTTGSGTATVPLLSTNTTSAETTNTGSAAQYWTNTGYQIPSAFANVNNIFWSFGRAPGFFDEVCYTGTGSATTFNHNLSVAPELMIVKCRSTATTDWMVYAASQGNLKYATINSTQAFQNDPSIVIWNGTSPTASVFSVGTDVLVNGSGRTYVAYLFASCLGVSKVGSYTGNGTTQTINCGFTGGARFVLLKRTDNTGSWFVYDTARGMSTMTDPYLLLNSTAAETATLGSVTTVTTGFALNAAILAAINTNGASYIY